MPYWPDTVNLRFGPEASLPAGAELLSRLGTDQAVAVSSAQPVSLVGAAELFEHPNVFSAGDDGTSQLRHFE